jgi:hypothetical protein
LIKTAVDREKILGICPPLNRLWTGLVRCNSQLSAI